MSYPMDLDEYSLDRLVEELRRRQEQAAVGLCVYCSRAPNTEPCKRPEMHAPPVYVRADIALHETGDRNGWDASKRMTVACAYINSLGLGTFFQEWLARRPR